MGMVWAYNSTFYHCSYFERMKNMINEDFLRREMNDIKASNGYTIGTLLLVLLPIGLSIVMQLMIIKMILA